MTETATTDPVFTSSTRHSGTILTPTSANLADLTPIMRTHPIGRLGGVPGIPYYVETTEICGRECSVATRKADDLVEIACVMRGAPIPRELRDQACAYELREEALILYKKKDLVS